MSKLTEKFLGIAAVALTMSGCATQNYGQSGTYYPGQQGGYGYNNRSPATQGFRNYNNQVTTPLSQGASSINNTINSINRVDQSLKKLNKLFH